MSPLEWLAVPVVATLAASLVVPVLAARRRTGLTREQRAERLRRELAGTRRGGSSPR